MPSFTTVSIFGMASRLFCVNTDIRADFKLETPSLFVCFSDETELLDFSDLPRPTIFAKMLVLIYQLLANLFGQDLDRHKSKFSSGLEVVAPVTFLQ